MEILQENCNGKAAILVPIETTYRGYRFRSRLEARWAVAFDALGVEWRYEAEGFNVLMPDGTTRRYLPDLWLPTHEAFAEIKPDREASRAVRPVLEALSATSSHPVLLIIGTPDVNQSPAMVLFEHGEANEVRLRECPFCAAILLVGVCGCVPGVTVTESPDRSARIDQALAEAQGARFEYEETPKPRPIPRAWPGIRRVYMAGPVLEETIEQTEFGESYSATVIHWRADCLEFEGDARSRVIQVGHRSGSTLYAGPTIFEEHGAGSEELAERCLAELARADAVFAWIDRIDTVGTIAELGAAHVLGKPIFIAFASEELHERFYFVRQLARVSVIAGDVKGAWQAFRRWRP